MDRAEKCFFCGRRSPESDLVAWFVEHERRTTHSACWVEAYRSERLSLTSSAGSGQPIEPRLSRPEGVAQAPRKTLDDIRRELMAEYPAGPEAVETPVPAAASLNGDARVVERHRSASRRRARRRRYATTAALGAIAGFALLVVSYVAVTRETSRPAAVASAPEVPAVAALPAPLTDLDQQLKALRSDLQALASSLERSDSRIAGMESRVRRVESSMQRLAADAASAAAARAVERTAAAAPVALLAPAATPLTAASSERWIPAERSAPERSSTPHDVRPVAEAVAPPRPRIESPTTTGVGPTRTAKAGSDNASGSSVPPTLRDKVRAEWRTIKQGFASANDDLKATMRDFARKITEE